MKLTKANIEQLANEIKTWLEEHNFANDVAIYYNGQQDDYDGGWKITHNVDPHDYFEYAAYEHILSMSFEGKLYEVLNYGPYIWEEQFNKLFEKYGVYFELGDAWNLTCYTCDDDTEVEYTRYKKPKEKIELYYFRRYEAPTELRAIMEHWYELSTQTGDIGSCVLGAGFNFEYQDNEYFMDACSPYQGSISWEQHKDDIQKMLEDIGATKIYYKWGNMD
jgi:hypothetical protein